MDTDKQRSLKQEELTQHWQQRMMPFMLCIILFLTLFFFVASLYQLYHLNNRIQLAPDLQHSELMACAERGETLMERQWCSLIVLESHILQQRYHQAKVLLMARVWVHYLGFVTGMMLALIGAIFILGKLREPASELTLGSESSNTKLPSNLKMHLVTQSPGIVLTILGTTLMLITILVHHPIEVTDKPVYTTVTVSEAGGKPSKPHELNLSPPGDQDSIHRLLEEARRRHNISTEEATE